MTDFLRHAATHPQQAATAAGLVSRRLLVGGLAFAMAMPLACRARESVDNNAPPDNIGATPSGANLSSTTGTDGEIPVGNGSGIDSATQPVVDANSPGTTPATNAGNSASETTPEPAGPSGQAVIQGLNATEQSRLEWFTRDNAAPNWPTGMYPFGLRRPAPPDLAAVQDAVWNKIVEAQAWHRRGEWEKAEPILSELEKVAGNADGQLIAFNLGACRQMMPEAVRGAAIDAYKKVLATKHADGEVNWGKANFRHFAARALAHLLMQHGKRVEAVDYARTAAFTVPMKDFVTEEPLSVAVSAERMLPTIYAYVGHDILRESPRALHALLFVDRPRLIGETTPDLLANVFDSCVAKLPAADLPAEALADVPQCHQRAFLKELLKRWLEDFPDHPRKSDLIRQAQAAGL